MPLNEDFLNKTKILTTVALAVTIISLIFSPSTLFVGLKSAEAAPPAYKIEISSAETGTITCTSGPNSGNTYDAQMRTTPTDAPTVKKKGGPASGWVYIDDGTEFTTTTMDTFVTSGQSNGRTFTLSGEASDDFCSGGFSTPVTITGSCGTDRQINVVGNSLTGAFTGDVTCTRV
jgi:hypothetical protein